jgi:hypothetical protein
MWCRNPLTTKGTDKGDPRKRNTPCRDSGGLGVSNDPFNLEPPGFGARTGISGIGGRHGRSGKRALEAVGCWLMWCRNPLTTKGTDKGDPRKRNTPCRDSGGLGVSNDPFNLEPPGFGARTGISGIGGRHGRSGKTSPGSSRLLVNVVSEPPHHERDGQRGPSEKEHAVS